MKRQFGEEGGGGGGGQSLASLQASLSGVCVFVMSRLYLLDSWRLCVFCRWKCS